MSQAWEPTHLRTLDRERARQRGAWRCGRGQWTLGESVPRSHPGGLALSRGCERRCAACCCHLEATRTSAASVGPRPRGSGRGYAQQGDKAPWDL